MKEQLPSGWVETSLGQVTWPSKLSAKPSEEAPQAYLGMDNVEASSTKILGSEISTNIRSITRPFTPGDTLYGRLRPYLNKVCTPEFKGLASSEFIVFPPSNALADNFLKYLLNSQTFVSFANNISDGDRPRIKWNQIKDWPFQLPPLAEQRRIVDAIEEHLSRIDAAESTAQTALTKLDTLRRTILTAAFSSRLVEPFNSRRTTDSLPEDWQWSTLGDISRKPQYGWTTKSAHGTGISYLRTTDISRGDIDWRSVPVCLNYPENLDKFILHNEDIVISRAGSVGVSCMIRNPPTAVFASYLIRLRILDNVCAAYAAYFLKSPIYWTAISDTKIGIAVQNVNAKKLAAIRIPLAPLADQKKIVAAIEEHFSRIDAAEATLERCLQRCSVLRRAVLAAAFSGRLVEQDPNDEPASALLERIAAEQPKRPTWKKFA